METETKVNWYKIPWRADAVLNLFRMGGSTGKAAYSSPQQIKGVDLTQLLSTVLECVWGYRPSLHASTVQLFGNWPCSSLALLERQPAQGRGQAELWLAIDWQKDRRERRELERSRTWLIPIPRMRIYASQTLLEFVNAERTWGVVWKAYSLWRFTVNEKLLAKKSMRASYLSESLTLAPIHSIPLHSMPQAPRQSPVTNGRFMSY